MMEGAERQLQSDRSRGLGSLSAVKQRGRLGVLPVMGSQFRQIVIVPNVNYKFTPTTITFEVFVI
jgi:hypothetical protein